jgi:hypothetical protein
VQCGTKIQATSTNHLGLLYGIGTQVFSLATTARNGPY